MCFWKKELPIWAYGLECCMCKMTFINAQAHYNAVMGDFDKEKKHENKIPILK